MNVACDAKPEPPGFIGMTGMILGRQKLIELLRA